ncbi:MAG: hypothetical protein GAK31_00334 [Stenotrophomonas maltophilia]|uniref:FecR protein domain-containing protein n=1 Tax=Stenotrophomonas maltophilia TaxID=40324 RepID=A0A7V8FJ34_STEMA|nr:MAG: hypothetical protein GAK31_00334 [Stenotrophomonas maltophilia]
MRRPRCARFSLLRREVTLLQGQATFQVGQDRRPFALRAAGLRVRDIGITFDVALQREQVRAGVTEGRVWVSAEGAAGPPLADLRAGQSARIDNAGRHARVSDENIAAMTVVAAPRGVP